MKQFLTSVVFVAALPASSGARADDQMMASPGERLSDESNAATRPNKNPNPIIGDRFQPFLPENACPYWIFET